MSGSKHHRIGAKNAHVTLHQNRSQKPQGLFQIQQEIKAVHAQIAQIQERNTALSAWMLKWASTMPVIAVEEWNQILEAYK